MVSGLSRRTWREFPQQIICLLGSVFSKGWLRVRADLTLPTDAVLFRHGHGLQPMHVLQQGG
jgi:hypothetical protein